MKINKEREKEYLNKINASVCPLCGNNNWIISDTVFQAIEFDYGGILINGTSLPIVPLVCSKCGNTYFINALMANLIDPSEAKDQQEIKNESRGSTNE